MGSKSQSTSQVQLTEEQKDQLRAQTDLLKNTLIPAYKDIVTGAGQAYKTTSGFTDTAREGAQGVSGGIQEQLGTQGAEAFDQGISGLADLTQNQATFGQAQQLLANDQLQNLFSDDYKEEQIDSAIQPELERARDAFTNQTAQYGGSGQLGSARAALADQNLAATNAQRLAATRGQVSAGVESQRQRAAEAILGSGQANTQGAQQGYSGLTATGGGALAGAQGAAQAQLGYAQTPQDLYNKYAGVVFGTPGGSGSNFTGTQGVKSDSKGIKFANGGLIKRRK